MIHIVFDGPPGPTAGRFIETGTPDGRGIGIDGLPVVVVKERSVTE